MLLGLGVVVQESAATVAGPNQTCLGTVATFSCLLARGDLWRVGVNPR